MFVGINHVTLVVKNKDLAEDFYFKKLGLERVIVSKSLWAKVGQQFIHISENSNSNIQQSFAHFAIEVDNFQSYIKQLVCNGINIFDFDPNLNKVDINQNYNKMNRCFFAEDPFGNIIEFIDSSNTFFKKEK